MPYGKRKDENTGLFHDQGGMFSDDGEESAARVSQKGVFIPVECQHCGDEIVLELGWDEVSAMAKHAPLQGVVREVGGYTCNVVCPRCYDAYMGDGLGDDRANLEAAARVSINIGDAKRWLRLGKKARGGATGKGGWKMYAQGMVGGFSCPGCGTMAGVKLYWRDAVKVVRGEQGTGWTPRGGGYVRALRCPACKGQVAASVGAPQLNQWLSVAVKKGLVR